jgi:hypothetical protein
MSDANEPYNTSGGGDVVDRALSPSESAALADAQAKLAAMVGDGGKQQSSGGSVRHSPTSNQRAMAERAAKEHDARRRHAIDVLTKARDAARGQEQSKGEEQQQSTEARRKQLAQELMASDLSTEDREAKLQELRKLINGERTPEEATKDSERTVQQQREAVGIKEHEFHSTQAREAWDEAREGEFLTFAEQEGWGGDLVRSLVSDYVAAAQQNDLQVTDELVESFHRRYQHRISQEVRDKLVRWIREGA